MGLFIVIGVVLLLVSVLGVTVPTSYYNRFTGQETWPDPITFAVPPLFAAGGNVVTVPAATTTLTLTAAAHASRAVLLQSTGGLVITPTAATGTGNIYTFIVIATISGGSVTIDFKAANASDVINGTGSQFKSGTGVTLYSCSTNTNLITLNGTTTGGIIGDFIQIIDVATHQWVIQEFNTQATGSVASPFSNH